jgi:hypothetical protein
MYVSTMVRRLMTKRSCSPLFGFSFGLLAACRLLALSILPAASCPLPACSCLMGLYGLNNSTDPMD